MSCAYSAQMPPIRSRLNFRNIAPHRSTAPMDQNNLRIIKKQLRLVELTTHLPSFSESCHTASDFQNLRHPITGNHRRITPLFSIHRKTSIMPCTTFRKARETLLHIRNEG